MVKITSEIGRLSRVLVHEPGLEVDGMVPSMMNDLLFDDILFGNRVREEHARFRKVMMILGIEVIDSRQLLEESLKKKEARDIVLKKLCAHLTPSSRKKLSEDPKHIAAVLVEGLRGKNPGHGVDADEIYELSPLPNWCFQRDPQIILHDSVFISSMATPARNREILLSTLIFRYHPDFKKVPILQDPFQTDWREHYLLGEETPTLEGGDVLVLSRELIAVGQSERTNGKGIRRFAQTLAAMKNGPKYLFVVELPRRRAYMHLDTIMTQIDRHECLVFPPVMCQDGREQARIYEIDLRNPDLSETHVKDLFSALKRRGLDLEPIPCGGEDMVDQQREQWTDGANAFALAPGIILLYDRNSRTVETLNKRGYQILKANDLLLGPQEINMNKPVPTCILLPSHEISRARGGPHCLTHPLVRQELK